MTVDFSPSDVLVGVEFEWDPGDEYEHYSDCWCESPCCSGTNREWIDPRDYVLDNIPRLRGWEFDIDCSNMEFRHAAPISVSEMRTSVELLIEHMQRYSPITPDLHADTGFHVHVNADPGMGPWVSKPSFLDAYMEFRDEVRDLCENPEERIDGQWAYTLPTNREDAIHRATYEKFMEMSQASEHGTSEIRLWDATMSDRLISERASLLHRIISRAFELDRMREAA